jgi:uncharacterized iron-regulated protein
MIGSPSAAVKRAMTDWRDGRHPMTAAPAGAGGGRRGRLQAAAAALAGSMLLAPAHACVPLAAWSVPVQGRVQEVSARQVIAQALHQPVILLGESHDSAEHHRWQLHTLAALHASRPDMAIGFEMFPRRVQAVLDRWAAGELSEAEFLERSDWSEVWGFDAALYLPLFHFARMHRLPMLALNVDRELVRRVGREGFDAVPEGLREGVGRPEPASREYLRELHAVYGQHGSDPPGGIDDAAFLRFVAGQLTWDRAMAEAIVQGQARFPGRLVVAVMGRGHTVPGAVPHQLRALGVAGISVLLPWERAPGCPPPALGRVDAVFGIEPDRDRGAAAGPRLGIALLPGSGPSARIDTVSPGSVAAAAGLRAGDVLIAVAGREVRRNADVLNAIARQAPGTWLPLRVRRDDVELELVAKFPPR